MKEVNKDLLINLMEEYQRLLDIEKKFDEWQKQYPDKHAYEYEGQRIPRARFERLGVMIRQTMIDFENRYSSRFYY